MVLTEIFDGFNTVLVRVQILISIILNLENPFCALLGEFLQGVYVSLEFFKDVR